ncbi:T-complex protein 11 homolog isoform X2 [Larus michahellis]|uniref:T-complex protein 11 homolog isoform X2 n=1 Tax=Larus michahellis TaxID=119627 RepID=UPI003D9BD06F
MESIRQKAEHEALGIHGLTTFVLGTMARLCMPVRDEEVQGLQALTDPAQLLREIFRVLGLMKMDMLNFTVQNIRTRLQDHTIQFERKKFQELLDKLPNSLDRTREWPCKAAAEVSASSSQPPPHPAVSGSPAMPSPGAISSSTAVPSLTSVLNQGYEAALEDVSDQVLQEVSRTLARLRYPTFTTDKCTSLKGQIKSIADKGNAVQHATGLKDLISLKSFSPVPQRLPLLEAGPQHKAKPRAVDSFLPQPFHFPRWTEFSKRFPKGP